MPRQCLFCENDAHSAEHVWPKWLNDVIQLKPGQEIGTNWFQRTAKPDSMNAKGWSKSEIANLTTKQVCGSCNNGWMAHGWRGQGPQMGAGG